MSKQAAQAHRLMRAGFYITVAALAKHHLGFTGFDYPVPVLLKLLRRPLEFGDMDCGFIYLMVVCHGFYDGINASSFL